MHSCVLVPLGLGSKSHFAYNLTFHMHPFCSVKQQELGLNELVRAEKFHRIKVRNMHRL